MKPLICSSYLLTLSICTLFAIDDGGVVDRRVGAVMEHPHAHAARTLNLCLGELTSRDGFARAQAAKQLTTSGNIAALQAVAPELFRNEDTATAFVPPDRSLKPISVYAGEIIRGIVEKHPGFSAKTKSWATSLSRRSSQFRPVVRDEMRAWWKENAGRIKAGRYSEVRPPKQQASSGSKGPAARTVPSKTHRD